LKECTNLIQRWWRYSDHRRARQWHEDNHYHHFGRMAHNHVECTFLAQHLSEVQSQNDMRYCRHLVLFQPGQGILVIFGIRVEMIDLADGVTMADNVDHRPIDSNFT
jgi:hypothetical protein